MRALETCADEQVDNFVLYDSVELEDLDHVPDLPRQTLIHPEVSE